MALVATLVANPSNPQVSDRLARAASATLGGAEVTWLAPGIACDISVREGYDADAVRRALKTLIGGTPVDVVVQEALNRRKKLLIADMDSTMIGQECIDELAAEVGVKDRVAEITVRAMNGEIEFEPALRERVALLAGLPVSAVENVITNRITLSAGGRQLVATMRANGAWTALVSGGFTLFTGPIAARLGFDEHRANSLDTVGDRFSGTVTEPILGRQAKIDALDEIAARLGLTTADAIAVGDGANDLGMIGRAGAGVALHAKPSVSAKAGIRIDHGDLTALLYLQGYSQADFVAS